jgi:hypothetical protein
MLAVSALGAGTLLLASASLRLSGGVWAAYVLSAVLARVKTIHFGVLGLAETSGASAARTLPLVFAAGRLGAVLAGPIVTVGGPALGPRWLTLVAAGLYAASAPVLLRRDRPGELMGERSVRPSLAPCASPGPPGLLTAIVVGAVALALGRLALTTQAGAILERSFSEAELNRVLGGYFMVANGMALVLQVGWVGRVLGRGGLPLLNGTWALLYLGAQSLLSFGPDSVLVALLARAVENELRNALRTPVANLLYEAMPPERRASARTLVIGVTVPATSLVGGLSLTFLGAHPRLLSALGMVAAVVIALSTWAQNRGWRTSMARGFTEQPG